MRDPFMYKVLPEVWALILREFERRGGGALNDCTQMADEAQRVLYGISGEVAFNGIMPDFTSANNAASRGFDPSCDFISPGGVKVDVKGRGRYGPPQVADPTWPVRVPEYSFRAQGCAAYVFSYSQFTRGRTEAEDVNEWTYLVGWLRKEEVPLRGVRVEPGNAVEQPSGYNGNRSDKVQYEIPMPSLNPMRTFREFCRAP
jgi:hypothetical protein